MKLFISVIFAALATSAFGKRSSSATVRTVGMMLTSPAASTPPYKCHPPRMCKGHEDQSPNPTPDLGYKKLLQLQKMFWTRFQYPNNIKEAQSVNSTIFSENVSNQANIHSGQLIPPTQHDSTLTPPHRSKAASPTRATSAAAN
jgi:hypothetical protein